MSVQVWLLFCATDTLLCFTPGPAVLLVVSQALARGARAGLSASLGILTANVAYFALSATSLGALLVASWEIFVLIKWVGAAYLIWVGARMVFGRSIQAASDVASQVAPDANRGSFSLAVLTQGANPKALVFFTAILPQFIDPATPVVRQIVILGVSSVVIEFAVLGIYVATCHTARGWIGQRRLLVRLQRLGGACLIGAGARLVVSQRG